jgi:predicted component of type VI protein secretion system
MARIPLLAAVVAVFLAVGVTLVVANHHMDAVAAATATRAIDRGIGFGAAWNAVARADVGLLAAVVSNDAAAVDAALKLADDASADAVAILATTVDRRRRLETLFRQRLQALAVLARTYVVDAPADVVDQRDAARRSLQQATDALAAALGPARVGRRLRPYVRDMDARLGWLLDNRLATPSCTLDETLDDDARNVARLLAAA